MLATPFAALEQRLNAAIMRRLANVVATVGGVQHAGLFESGYALGAVGPAGIATTQPTLTLPTSALVGEVVGQEVTIGAAAYIVAAHEPDGTGLSRLLLEVAA